MQDVNNALSPEFPPSDSTKRIVVKCHIRKAKLLCMFARYEEAMEEYYAAQALRGEETIEDKPLKKAIDEGLAAPKGSKRQRKDELLRAVDVGSIPFPYYVRQVIVGNTGPGNNCASIFTHQFPHSP